MDIRLAHADTIVFLDLPTSRCLSGAVKRFVRFRGRTRPEMADGCRERLTAEYLGWICTYRRRRRPAILQTLRRLRSEKRIVILESHRAADDFVNELSGGVA